MTLVAQTTIVAASQEELGAKLVRDTSECNTTVMAAKCAYRVDHRWQVHVSVVRHLGVWHPHDVWHVRQILCVI